MAGDGKSSFERLAQEASLQTQEMALALKKNNASLEIGIPKEITYQEKRIPLTPLSVQQLVHNGHTVKIESNAGEQANFSDLEYSNAGAEICYRAEECFQQEIVLKVDPPTEQEIEYLKPGQSLISALQLQNLNAEVIRSLMAKKINLIGYEFLRDDSGNLPIIRSMSEIAGRASVLIAAEYLSNNFHGKGELIGGIPGIQPTKFVVIGAGSVAEYATRAAMALGAQVQVFDNSLHKLRRLETNLGQRINSATIMPYTLKKALTTCDVAIGALRSPEGRSPCVVTEEMVAQMKPKSLIIDISIDQGGCFETSKMTNHEKPVFEEHGVIHYCVPNIASRVSRTASYALSNIFTPFLLEMSEYGGVHSFLYEHDGVRAGTVIYKGHLTNSNLGERFGIRPKELNFLLAGIKNKD
jgi:alanine dehydrogenase